MATLKTAERNSSSGMIGSSARCSWRMKSAEQDDAGDRRGRRSRGDAHAYSLPPQVVSRISALTPAVSSTAPR